MNSNAATQVIRRTHEAGRDRVVSILTRWGACEENPVKFLGLAALGQLAGLALVWGAAYVCRPALLHAHTSTETLTYPWLAAPTVVLGCAVLAPCARLVAWLRRRPPGGTVAVLATAMLAGVLLASMETWALAEWLQTGRPDPTRFMDQWWRHWNAARSLHLQQAVASPVAWPVLCGWWLLVARPGLRLARWLIVWRRLGPWLSLVIVFLGGHAAVAHARGVLAVVLVGAEWCAFLFFAAALYNRIRRRPRFVSPAAENLLVATVATIVALVLGECALVVVQAIAPAEYKPTMPDDLAFRYTYHSDFYLMGVLHEYNGSMFRERAFTPRERGVFRVVVLGDSITFGQGIPVEARYSNILERVLGQSFCVEVLNLGRMGYQSQDVVRIAREYVPVLEPDLVLYGHCLNDFLPAGEGQYVPNLRWQFPLPSRYKTALVDGTFLGAFAAKRYNSVLMKAGIRRDFIGDILLDFAGRQQRFSADMRALNTYVVSQGLPPVVALVLNQYPSDRRNLEVARIAEAKMQAAGMTVLPATYQDAYAVSGVRLYLRWDGHPNELANELFTDAFLSYFTTDTAVRLLAPFATDVADDPARLREAPTASHRPVPHHRPCTADPIESRAKGCAAGPVCAPAGRACQPV